MRLKRGDKAWDRFWSKVNKGPDCWEWNGCRHQQGYGMMWFNGKPEVAHRIVREMGHGLIPKGMCVCHTCDNPPCVRPSHLFLGTYQDNMTDAIDKGRIARGEAHGNSILTEEEVHQIRTSALHYKEIAEQYNIHPETVGKIKTRRAWTHIK